jgi:hypothetical protein
MPVRTSLIKALRGFMQYLLGIDNVKLWIAMQTHPNLRNNYVSQSPAQFKFRASQNSVYICIYKGVQFKDKLQNTGT